MDQKNQPSIDINSADVEALTQLKGVGKRLAERIIEARPFESVEDLTRVRGISTKDVEKLRPYLTVFVASDPFEAVEEPIMEEEIEMMTEEEADETAAEAALEETALEESNDDLMEDVSAEVETTLDAAEEEIIEVEEDAASEYFESVTAQVEEMDELEEDELPGRR